MKPFSKMEALSGKPVVTRDGRKVKIIGEVPADVIYPVVGHIEGASEVATWTSDGKYFTGNDRPTTSDLFMAPEIKAGWVAFGLSLNHSKDIVGFCTHVWPAEEEA